MRAGDTFFGPHPQSPGVDHLFVVLSSPDHQGKFALVNITSQDAGKEQTCVLLPEDHSFVRHETVVRYRSAVVVDLQLFEKAIENGIMKPQEAMKAAVLERMQNGALASRYTEIGVKNAVRAELALGPE